MGKQSRRPTRRHRRQRRHERASIAVQCAASHDGSPESIELAKRASHDLLIRSLGDRRRSGVRWDLIAPADVADAIDVLADPVDTLHTARHAPDLVEQVADEVREAGGTATPDLSGDYDELRRWFVEHPDGWLIIATADAVLT